MTGAVQFPAKRARSCLRDASYRTIAEHEYGAPFERPAQYGARAFLADEEYASAFHDARVRNEKDLGRVDAWSHTTPTRTAGLGVRGIAHGEGILDVRAGSAKRVAAAVGEGSVRVAWHIHCAPRRRQPSGC